MANKEKVEGFVQDFIKGKMTSAKEKMHDILQDAVAGEISDKTGIDKADIYSDPNQKTSDDDATEE